MDEYLKTLISEYGEATVKSALIRLLEDVKEDESK